MAKERASRIEAMVVFARVVEAGSLTRAAKALGTTRSAVSKSIARLELHLGTRLLQRTTRELSVTAAGHACYVHCARIATEVESAERAAGELRATPHGVLRVSCSSSLGILLGPSFPAFLALYPELVFELGLSESLIELVREGIDVGIRLGPMQDSTLVARKLAAHTMERLAIYAVYPNQRHLSPNVRAFIDFMVTALEPWAIRDTE